MDFSEEIYELMQKLATTVAKKKELEATEKELKETLLETMRNQGLENVSLTEGKVHLQNRTEKDYGNEIRELEIELKQRKKLADDMGDFTVLSQKQSLVFNLPKD
jgi:predicted ATPase